MGWGDYLNDPVGVWTGLPRRFEQRIMPEPNSGCWLWIGATWTTGYGGIQRDKISLLAHRAVYELLKGSIPEYLEIDHLCRTRCCVNPDHLEAVTAKVNSLRGESPLAKNARKTHCQNGHELIPENIYKRIERRKCIACNKAGNRMRYYKSKKQ